MLARVRIVTRPGAALVVPQEALVFDTNAYFAFVDVGPDAVERRKVDRSRRGTKRATRAWSRDLRAGDRWSWPSRLQVNALWHEAHGES